MKNRKEEILKSKFIDGEYDEIMGCLNTDITPSITKAMQQYADEFACAFAEFMSENYVPILQHGELQYWQKNYQDKSKKYTTTELLEIFKKEQDGK